MASLRWYANQTSRIKINKIRGELKTILKQ